MVSGNRNNPLFVLQERLIGPRFRIGPLSGRSIQSARSRRLDLLDVLRVPRPRLPVLPRAAATEALVVKSRKPYLCLPFIDSSFDAIISRGVLLSYVVDPKAVLAESHRVLRPTGQIAMDAMNWIRGRARTISRGFQMTKDGPAYTEFFVSSGRQVKRIYNLKEDSPYTALASQYRSCAERPKDLRKYAVSTTKYEARLFTQQELKALAEDTGFTDVRIAPLGQLTYALRSEDKTLKDFVVANRHQLSRLMLLLGSHLRHGSALHLFIMAWKG